MEFERSIRAIATGTMWIAVVIIMKHSGELPVEMLLEWPIYLLGAALIFVGIAEAAANR